MSSQRGNVKKPAQKHQNSVAFKHNPKSKKTGIVFCCWHVVLCLTSLMLIVHPKAQIANIPIEGVCPKCREVLEWKKQYRKYKPLTAPAKCSRCGHKKITHAYHTICKECVDKQPSPICAKCGTAAEIDTPLGSEKIAQQEQQYLQQQVENMSERERRSFFRKLEKENALAKKKRRNRKAKTDENDNSNSDESDTSDNDDDNDNDSDSDLDSDVNSDEIDSDVDSTKQPTTDDNTEHK